MASYIVRSPGRHVLHVRVVVPRDLQGSIGKRELRRSLGTADPVLGRLRALQVAHRITSLFRAMKRSKDNPATMKALIVCLAEGTVRLEDPYTSRDVDEAIRIAKELGTLAPKPSKQPLASQPTPGALPLSSLWKLYASEQTAVEGWRNVSMTLRHQVARI